jgi:hypothetical protein
MEYRNLEMRRQADQEYRSLKTRQQKQQQNRSELPELDHRVHEASRQGQMPPL